MYDDDDDSDSGSMFQGVFKNKYKYYNTTYLCFSDLCLKLKTIFELRDSRMLNEKQLLQNIKKFQSSASYYKEQLEAVMSSRLILDNPCFYETIHQHYMKHHDYVALMYACSSRFMQTHEVDCHCLYSWDIKKHSISVSKKDRICQFLSQSVSTWFVKTPPMAGEWRNLQLLSSTTKGAETQMDDVIIDIQQVADYY